MIAAELVSGNDSLCPAGEKSTFTFSSERNSQLALDNLEPYII